jgi:hypothetical protein
MQVVKELHILVVVVELDQLVVVVALVDLVEHLTQDLD